MIQATANGQKRGWMGRGSVSAGADGYEYESKGYGDKGQRVVHGDNDSTDVLACRVSVGMCR